MQLKLFEIEARSSRADTEPKEIRIYRNRRIGEFLQEIQLSEKKSTGITKVLNALRVNGSPAPLFETDQERETFFATVYLHEGFEPIVRGNDGGGDRSGDRMAIGERINLVLEHIEKNGDINNASARELLGLSSTAVNNLFRKMVGDGLIEADGDKRYRVYRMPHA